MDDGNCNGTVQPSQASDLDKNSPEEPCIPDIGLDDVPANQLEQDINADCTVVDKLPQDTVVDYQTGDGLSSNQDVAAEPLHAVDHNVNNVNKCSQSNINDEELSDNIVVGEGSAPDQQQHSK